VSLADLSMPTVSSPLTMKGTILGTLQYMSPEQLEGKEVDARTDLFAFGGVLYEMLTGRRPFEGKSQASLIGAILDHQPPPVTTFQPVAPPMLEEIVARCLAKDPDDRWQSARDLKRQLEWVAKQASEGSHATATATATPTGGVQVEPPSLAARIARVGAAIFAGAALAGAAAWMVWPKAPPAAVPTRFSVDLPAGQAFTRTGRHVIALSPDGSSLVYVANEQLYLRKMGELTAVPIAGTEKSNPAEPIFSPDGQWVAFWSESDLKKVPIAGGTPVTLAAGVSNPSGSSWTGDRILLGQDSPRGIVEVPANGGAAKMLVGVDASKDELAYGPQLIAGGRAVLFTLRTGRQAWNDSLVVVQELATGRRTTVVDGGADARVLPTGHLAYVRDATLFAVPFDQQRLAITGSAVPMLPEVSVSGAAQFTLSASGAMAAVSAVDSDRDIVWLTRQGQRTPAASFTRTFRSWFPALALSPDGTRATAIVEATGRADAWVATLNSNTFTRMTFAGASSPVWTPDGSRLCFVSSGEAFCQAADGSGKPVSLFKSPGMNALEFSPDGSRLVFAGGMGTDGDDIMIATLGPPLEVRPLIKTTFAETFPALSPDGRWIAYTSNESGRREVYVRPFPDVDQGRWQVSTDEGTMPRWAKNGRELLFRRGSDFNLEFWVSAIQPGASFIAGRPTQIASGAVGASNAYDVAADGRLLVTMPAGGANALPSRIVVAQHWFDELKARVPASR
jgi:eukaryotic-like serine/threonine-protein kinase